MININWIFDSTWGNGLNHDWEALKKEGTVTETTEEKNGFKTIIKTFVSFDGETKITSSESISIVDETKSKISEINKQIETAVRDENYELAAQLKKEKETLLKK